MLLNKAYYTFKFLVPRPLQIQLRRYYVNRKRSLHVPRQGETYWYIGNSLSPSMYHDPEMLHQLDIEYDASTFDTDPFEPQPDGMR
jgi:hypothetical protein